MNIYCLKPICGDELCERNSLWVALPKRILLHHLLATWLVYCRDSISLINEKGGGREEEEE